MHTCLKLLLVVDGALEGKAQAIRKVLRDRGPDEVAVLDAVGVALPCTQTAANLPDTSECGPGPSTWATRTYVQRLQRVFQVLLGRDLVPVGDELE